MKKETHKTLTDSDSSSSSDDEENKDMNRITSYRGNTNGSSKPKSQRINNNEEFSNSDLNNDVQMELTNSTDFKAPSEDNNWADFGKFSNNQVCCFLILFLSLSLSLSPSTLLLIYFERLMPCKLFKLKQLKIQKLRAKRLKLKVI
jgi:hypothetical protein